MVSLSQQPVMRLAFRIQQIAQGHKTFGAKLFDNQFIATENNRDAGQDPIRKIDHRLSNLPLPTLERTDTASVITFGQFPRSSDSSPMVALQDSTSSLTPFHHSGNGTDTVAQINQFVANALVVPLNTVLLHRLAHRILK